MTTDNCYSCPNASSNSNSINFPAARILIGCLITIVVGSVFIICCCMLYFVRRVFSSSLAAHTGAAAAASGLDRKAIASLPVFTCSPSAQEEKVECAVCLTELGDGEKGRLLPVCGHRFHAECIDMWLTSHSSCPLCRSIVRSEFSEPPV